MSTKIRLKINQLLQSLFREAFPVLVAGLKLNPCHDINSNDQENLIKRAHKA